MISAIKANNSFNKSADITCERKTITNCNTCLILAMLCSLIPAMINKESIASGIGFLAGTIIMLLGTGKWQTISFYYIALLINSSLAEVPLPLSQYTVTNIIYVYFIVLFIYTMFRKADRKFIVPLFFYVMWFLYQIIQIEILHINTSLASFLLSWGLYLGCYSMQILCTYSAKYEITLVSSIIIAAAFVCAVGYVELLSGHTFFYSLWANGERYRFGILRTGSTLADANFLCLIQVSILMLLQTDMAKSIFNNRKLNLLSMLIVIQCCLTFSRMGILAMIICTAALFIYKHRTMILLIVPVLLIAMLYAVPIISAVFINYNESSATARIRIVQTAIGLWTQVPWIGIGNGAFSQYSVKLLGLSWNTMNTYIQQLTELGLIGFLFYLFYFIIIIVKTHPFRCLLHSQEQCHDQFCFFLACLSWLICSASLDTFSKVLPWLFPALLITVLSRKVNHNECEEANSTMIHCQIKLSRQIKDFQTIY